MEGARPIFAKRHWTHLFCLWLSLGIVFAHAILPQGTSPGGRGSAFSAFTSDVSLGPSRRGEPAKGKKQAGISAEDTESSGGASVDQAFDLAGAVAAPVLQPRSNDPSVPAGEPVRLASIGIGFQARAPPLV